MPCFETNNIVVDNSFVGAGCEAFAGIAAVAGRAFFLAFAAGPPCFLIETVVPLIISWPANDSTSAFKLPYSLITVPPQIGFVPLRAL